MKISRRTVRGCRVAILLGILLLLANAIWYPLEPRFNGKRLSVWVRTLPIQPWDCSPEEDLELRRRQDEAADAIRHLSADALPLALKYCGTHDSSLAEKLKGWTNGQKMFAVHIPADYDYQQMGIAIFQALGPAGKPAAPSLIRLFRKNDPYVANAASLSLVHIGPENIPLLTAALTNDNDRVRMGAAMTLGGFKAQAQTAVPALIRSLNDSNAQVRAAAALALAQISSDSATVIPALLSCLKDKDARVRESTALALSHIGKQPELVVPALFARIEMETNTPVLSPFVITAIGRFGTNAKPWSPILVQMIESNRFGFWTGSALNVLKKIDPEAAETLIQRREFIRTNSAPKFSYRNPPVQHLQRTPATMETNMQTVQDGAMKDNW